MTTTTNTISQSGTIVVGVDGSPAAEHAVLWAADEARLQQRALLILHIEKPLGTNQQAWLASAGISPREITDQIREDAQTMVDRAHDLAADRSPGTEIDTMIRAGDPRDVLLELAHTSTMIVLGSRGRGPVASFLLGSVSIAVSRHATCPVVIVRPYDADAPRRGVLVGTDGTDHSVPTLEQAFAEASLHDLPLTVVHCLWDPVISTAGWANLGSYDPGSDEAPARVAEVLAGLREKFPNVDVDVVLAKGRGERCLCDHSRNHELLVVGRHSSSLVERLGTMSLTTSIVEHASGPVLIVS